jgi:NADH-quinone oxidoreductase subunit L
MRKMGGLWKKMPITAWTYLISTLAIAGIAPLSGYYSKHAILESLNGNSNSFLAQSFLFGTYTSVFGLVLNLTALCTAFYMMRSFAMTFMGEYRGGHSHAHASHDDSAHSAGHDHHDGHDHDEGHAHEPHESPWKMTLPLVVLAALAVVAGLALGGQISHGAYSLQAYLQPVVPSHAHEHGESLLAALAHSWVGILGVVLGVLFYTSLSSVPGVLARSLAPLTKLSQGKWFFDEVYSFLLIRPLEGMARFLWRGVDQGVIDGTVNGTAAVIDMSGEITRHTQTGQIRHYALFMFIGTVVVITFYMVM